MAQFQEALLRDTVLVVGAPRIETFDALKLYSDEYGKRIKIIVIADKSKLKSLERINKLKKSRKFKLVTCNFKSPRDLKNCVDPIAPSLLAVTAQFENVIPDFKKLIPYVPYLHTPTSESLDWATDKIKMRRMFDAHDPKLSPKFMIVKDQEEATIARVVQKINFPVIVKPSGLGSSVLVEPCYHEEELRVALKKIFKKIDSIHKKSMGRGVPQILVESMVEGPLYSIDGYVNDRGNIYFLPPVHVKTGRAVGFDDYFSYQRLTPTKLRAPAIQEANAVAQSGVRALGLRSTTFHAELIKGDRRWKIVEIGPRQGGYRHKLYELAFGVNHILNDMLIRIPQKPIISRKRKGFAAALKIYSKKEGNFASVSGLAKIKKIDSFEQLYQHKKKGDKLLFARNGGKEVIDVMLFNKDRSKLLADIRRVEKTLKVIVDA